MTSLEMIYYKDDFKSRVDYRTESNKDKVDFEEFCKKYLNSSNGFYTDKVSPIHNTQGYNYPSYPIYDLKYPTENYLNQNKKYDTYQSLEDYFELNARSKKSESIENYLQSNSNKKSGDKRLRNMTLPSVIYHEKKSNQSRESLDKSKEKLNNKKNENKSLNGILMLNNGTTFNLNKTKEPSSPLMNKPSINLTPFIQETALTHDYIIEQYPSIYLTEDKTSKEAQILNNFKMQNFRDDNTNGIYDKNVAENFLYLNHENNQNNYSIVNSENIKQIVNEIFKNESENLKTQERVEEKIQNDNSNLTALEKIEKIIDEVEQTIKLESENLKKIEKSNQENKNNSGDSKRSETTISWKSQNIIEKSENNQNGIDKNADQVSNEDNYTIFIEAKLDNDTKENLWYELPKKISFNQEFSRRKTQTNRIPIQINTQINIIDDHNSINYLAPFNVVPSTAQVEKPYGWLGLEVVACGINKLSKLPLPKNNYSIETGDFGDDAGFWAENVTGDAIGNFNF